MTGASGHHAARLTFQSASVLNEYFALPAWSCGPLRGAHVDWFCMPSRVLSVLTKCEPWALSVIEALDGLDPGWLAPGPDVAAERARGRRAFTSYPVTGGRGARPTRWRGSTSRSRRSTGCRTAAIRAVRPRRGNRPSRTLAGLAD